MGKTDTVSTSNYSEIIGRHFEETANGYMAAFFERDEITVERIIDWLDDCEPGAGYHQLTYTDPFSWDMFLYYAPEGGIFGYYSFRFLIEDSTVRIYVIADEASPTFLSDYMLIRIQAPPRSGAWPNTSELYINGVRIEKQGTAHAGT